MKVDFAYEQPLDEIVTEVLRMETILESEQAELMTAIGKEIKKEVKNNLPKSNEDAKHMRDDIKVTVQGKKAKTGITGVTVHGGKETAFKWHLLDDGTRNPDGSVHTPALHFTSKAMQAATPRIEQLINDLERSVTK
jgi:HK97 gp10 family phage protein